MNVNAKAGHPIDAAMLIDVPRLMTAHYALRPDPSIREQRVAFGTSRHAIRVIDHRLDTVGRQHPPAP